MSLSREWLQPIERDAGRYSVVFLHLGRGFSPYREHLKESIGTAMTVSTYLEGGSPSQDSTMLVLTDVELCASSRRHGLGTLRAKILDDIDAHGHKFVLVSTIARSAFPTVPGSDLLADAKHVFADLLPATSDSQGLSCLPGWDGDDGSKGALLAECVAELSAETVINLGELIWDSGLSPNECLDSLAMLDRESLRGAGLLKLAEDKMIWTSPADWKALRTAVAVASSRYMTTQDWLAQSFVDLWIIERQLRNAVRDALMLNHGAAWRMACANGDLAEELVSRARKDVQPRADQLNDLRDPLEWLTTSELLDLRELRQLGGLGLESYMWTKLRADLLPIRNRAAHMRVVSERDARTVATWRKLILSKVSCRSTSA